MYDFSDDELQKLRAAGFSIASGGPYCKILGYKGRSVSNKSKEAQAMRKRIEEILGKGGEARYIKSI